MNRENTPAENPVAGTLSTAPNVKPCDEGRYRVECDFALDDPSHAVVAAIGTLTQTDPLELDPLYQAIDPDALNQMVSATREECQVSFEYADFDVTVDSTGAIIFEQPTGENV
ncbi:HalOD1 output domain-containing protein [Natrinema sp. DC36]|uniref:HalOD1 output domain-containing protein n=1 Tax=Natrinema sp. DC36 TaxID=2878680 RepID=UPI001CF0518B|nr:HalOD1 output domain-containing protein [Natrinema sp. DC36]